MHTLDLSIQEMETLDAPAFIEWVVGIGVGIALGTAAVLIT